MRLNVLHVLSRGGDGLLVLPHLAVDFVLSNYFPKLWRDLRLDGRYKELIDRSQWRCWRPYSMASAERWSSGASEWDGLPIWPQVVYRGP